MNTAVVEITERDGPTWPFSCGYECRFCSYPDLDGSPGNGDFRGQTGPADENT